MLWLLVLAGCCVGLGFHCDIMISAFFSSPISTETRFLLDTEELPHFSFCPSNFLNEHRLSGNILWNKRWTNLSALWSSALLPIWNEVFQEILNTTELFPSIAVQSVREGLIKHFLYRAMVVPLNWDETMIRARDSVLSCRFALKKCNFNNFRLQYHPVHKICFTFNFIGNMTRRGFPEEMFLYLAAHNRPFGRQISGSVLSNAGGIYELHPQGTFPVMGKIARQYQQSTVQMGSIEKTVTELVDSPQFHCEEANTSSDISSSMVTLLEDDFDKGEVVEKQYQASEELCIQLALQDAVMKQCDCISTLLPLTTTQYKVSSTHQTLRHCNEFPSSVLPDDVTIIHEQGVVNDSARFMVHLQRPNETVRLREYLLAVNGYTQFRAELRCQLRILTNASLSVSLAHNCHPPCHKVSYLVDLYYQKFVTEFDFEYQEQVIYFRDSINESQTNYFDNYLYKLMDEWDDTIMSGIYLYFESADVKKVIESFSYSLINFLSDLGGVLGLWFGFSVASVFEILELAASCIRCRRG